MKVLSSVFQGFVMVLVVLFSLGALEVVSYRTINRPLAQVVFKPFYGDLKDWQIMNKASGVDFLQEVHWTIRVTRPYWFKP